MINLIHEIIAFPFAIIALIIVGILETYIFLERKIMKIFKNKSNKGKQKKSWSIALVDLDNSGLPGAASISMLDSDSGELINDLIKFYENGTVQIVRNSYKALNYDGYDPHEHNNRFHLGGDGLRLTKEDAPAESEILTDYDFAQMLIFKDYFILWSEEKEDFVRIPISNFSNYKKESEFLEEEIEAAYWYYDTLRSEHKGRSERDVFKMALRGFVNRNKLIKREL